MLELAARHDFMILEDDIYGDLQGRHAVRLASLDDGRRVIYVGGFSKTLAANLRVGFVAAHPALARELRDIKALTGLVVAASSASAWSRASSSSAVTSACSKRLRIKLDECRARTCRGLAAHGREDRGAAARRHVPVGGFRPRHERAGHGRQPRGRAVAPGSLFSPTQLPSTWMRVAAATCLNDAAMTFLERAMQPKR